MPGTYAGEFDIDGDWTLRAERLIVRGGNGQAEIRIDLFGMSREYGTFQIEGTATRATGGYEAELPIRYANYPESASDTAKLRLQVDESHEGCRVEGWWTEMVEDGEMVTWELSGDLQPWEPL